MEGHTLGFLVTGFVVGIASGLLGIGGAVILIPALVFLFKFSQVQAQGTTLGALVPPIGIFAALQYWRNGDLDVRVAALIAGGFVFGAFVGAWTVPFVPQVWLRRVFALLLFYTAAKMLFADAKSKSGAILPGAVAALVVWLVWIFRRKRPDEKRPEGAKAPPGEIYHI